ncbi:RCC1 domain-containing protein [Oxalobacter formigenes]|uniref:Regulator of chromosome condensation (RCC1) n=1 Tax=Oxalobacter formigenes OXCC13 TaxID=556269 RepID=C3X8U1_OXAFO|nr:hypothetical protein [Oxalobacter formigenes]ARQ46330.1 Regulator of chromosome condensation (RCC1) repeat protein [Oxalobacter formigenes]ARQ78447.1 hypothetical protein BRW84_07360 [Oxalobacter formigenes OXCC13]EEO29617.1 hypothetical protein OFBG_00645 [Oxalobacter formigenes OXCC13]MCZ4062977.1 hypothetical protein [Oxalobacter formigenes]QDX32973.1 hypothetical protein FPZ51_04925 [Oxalobacter formigenes]
MRNRLLTITFTIACLIAIVVLVRQANIRPSGTRHHFATAENGHHLAAGAHHSLYIDSEGRLWAWGDAKFKNRETAIPVKVADSVMTVSAGDTSATSFYIAIDGTLFGWGDTRHGQMGILSESPIIEPMPIMTDIKTVDAGHDTPYAIDSHSSLWTWGMNNPSRTSGDPGKEMDGTLIDPEKVMDLVKLVSSSATHTLAQREDRSLWVWGENTSGALATGSTQRQTHPYKADLSPLEGRFIVKLATRNNASFAVTEDGTLWTWGSANAMLPGKPTQELPSKTLPVKIEFIDNVADIALGDESILILKNDGSVWAYGIGPVTGKTSRNWTTPVRILSDAVEIASGPHHALALKKDGTVWSWGDNDAGQLGNGTRLLSLKPVQVHFHPAISAT